MHTPKTSALSCISGLYPTINGGWFMIVHLTSQSKQVPNPALRSLSPTYLLFFRWLSLSRRRWILSSRSLLPGASIWSKPASKMGLRAERLDVAPFSLRAPSALHLVPLTCTVAAAIGLLSVLFCPLSYDNLMILTQLHYSQHTFDRLFHADDGVFAGCEPTELN